MNHKNMTPPIFTEVFINAKGILEPPIYFYRDKEMNEIDLLIEESGIFKLCPYLVELLFLS